MEDAIFCVLCPYYMFINLFYMMFLCMCFSNRQCSGLFCFKKWIFYIWSMSYDT